MARDAHPAYDYRATLLTDDDAHLQAAHALGESLRPGMQISPTEGQFLHLLVRLIRAQRILEIGTFVGYSALWMAKALPADGMLYTLEHDPTHAHHARAQAQAAAYGRAIHLHEGDALALLDSKALQTQQWDMVVLDAQKSQYPDYIEKTYPNLRPGGLMVADNTLLFDTAYAEAPSAQVSRAAWEGMRRCNRMLADATRFSSVLLPTLEGMTVAQKRV